MCGRFWRRRRQGAAENIHLIVNLEPWREGMLYDRLGINEQRMTILGVDVASVTIPVKPGRNLAVILEVAAMNQRQKIHGLQRRAGIYTPDQQAF
jgi:HPr kinase/phosphorylase